MMDKKKSLPFLSFSGNVANLVAKLEWDSLVTEFKFLL